MNLREFIKEALVDIVSGVADARTEVIQHEALIGSDPAFGHVREAKILTDKFDRTITMVEFDIALTQADSKDSKAGIGVFLASVGVGAQGASHGETSSLSRIKFSVPVVLPGCKGEEK